MHPATLADIPHSIHQEPLQIDYHSPQTPRNCTKSIIGTIPENRVIYTILA